MDVIPAIDLLDGKVVRLRQGRYDEVTTYDAAPDAVAATWRGVARRLHVVDLEGARAGHPVQREAIRAIARAFGPGVQVGGGVRTADAATEYLELGADRVVFGTAALRDPDAVHAAARAHPDRIVVAVDAKNGLVATDGWTRVSERRAVDVVQQFAGSGLAAVLYTDIDRDGTEVGPNVEATANLATDGGVDVIASGGVGTLDHLRALAVASLSAPRIVAAIVGRALHEDRFTLADALAATRRE